MLTIYAIPISLYCAKLRILLRYKALEWNELPPPGGYGSDEYKLTIPSGNLPAMVDGKLTLADSEVIAEYLNEKYPQPPMLPDDISQRAKIRERSRFHDTRLEPELRKLFPYIDENHADAAFFELQSKLISNRLNQLPKLLDNTDTTVADALTLGDCGLPITFIWIDFLTPVFDLKVDWPDAVLHYRTEVERHQAVAQELQIYRQNLNQWLSSSNS